MKYWVFENGDVLGPFPLQELMKREGFGPHSLVCPETQGEESSAWREASSYADFQFEEPLAQFPSPILSDVEKPDVFEEELNTLLEEKSPIISPEQPVAQEPAENLHVPSQAPSKPGPIEDYFNNIKGEDLGNILGIPDPNENSDMNLSRALNSQFAQTKPPVSEGEDSVLEEDPFDAFTAKEDLTDKQESIEDDLDAVEPITQQVPVVLVSPSPQEEPFHPKYRIRKKREEQTDIKENPVPPQASAEHGAPQVSSSLAKEEQKDPAEEESAVLLKENPAPAPLPKPSEEEPAAQMPAAAQAEEKSPAQEIVSLPLSQEARPEEPSLDKTPLPKTFAQGISLSLQDEEPLSVQLGEDPAPVVQTPVKKEETAPLVKEPKETSSAPRQSDNRPSKAEKEQKEPLQQAALPEADKTPKAAIKAQPSAAPVEKPAAAETAQAAPLGNTQPEVSSAAPKEEAKAPVLAVLPEDKKVQPSPKPEPEQKPAAVLPVQETQAAPEPENKPAVIPPAKEEQSAPQSAQPKETAAASPVDGIFQEAPVETPEIKEPIKDVAPVVDTQVNRVKPTLKKTAEIDQFLNEKIQEEKSRVPASKKMLWAVGFLAVILALLGLLWLFGQQQAVTANKQPVPAVVQDNDPIDELMPDTAPDVPSAQEVLSMPQAPKAPEVSAQDMALQVVKNYELPDSNGKIADYFDRIYKSKLAQGYNAVWSATPLHNNVYIVKYRLSKTRLEPVVYLFQVDVSTNKLIGALNNITLDLVGKIN